MLRLQVIELSVVSRWPSSGDRDIQGCQQAHWVLFNMARTIDAMGLQRSKIPYFKNDSEAPAPVQVDPWARRLCLSVCVCTANLMVKLRFQP
jgi:hypothetical protein